MAPPKTLPPEFFDQQPNATEDANDMPATTAKPQGSYLARVWEWANRGRISPDRALQLLTLGSQGKGTRWTVEELEKYVAAPPKLNELDRKTFHIPGFGDVDYSTFVAGLRASEGRTLSSFTSPASIATAGLSKMAKMPGAIGNIAKALLTGSGLAYGATGLKSTAEGIKEGVRTPEGAQKTLLGLSQVAGSAPAAVQAGRVGKAGVVRMFPVLEQGERAFIASLRPPVKKIPALTQAYRRVLPELQKAKIQTFEDLHEFAETKRTEVAKQTAAEIARYGGKGFTVDAKSVGTAVRSRITGLMKLRMSAQGKLPVEGRFIQREAENIERNLTQNPKTLGEAEQLVQDLNATLAEFRKLPPQSRHEAVRRGDPEAVFAAVKEELQNQIESQMSGYRDMKQKYGDYREIDNQASERINTIARTYGNPDMLQRRGAENLLGALGALFSGQYLHGVAEIMAGRGAGDILLEMASTPEKLLSRGMRPPSRSVPFGGQIVQPIAEAEKRP